MAVRMTWASRSQQRVRRAAKHSMAGRLPKVRRRASRLDCHTKDGVPHGIPCGRSGAPTATSANGCVALRERFVVRDYPVWVFTDDSARVGSARVLGAPRLVAATRKAGVTVTADARFDVAEALLLERHADRVQHSGGTLLAHLGRVRDRLAAWDASPELQLAGLCHASGSAVGGASWRGPSCARSSRSARQTSLT